uniref:TATA box-binding protein-like 1 n=1 Tax=Timema californicum TaxID=61474 RepID=A0A7R9IW65_TIMCA|nr:unnamed protein product [Timema californicum]
MNNGIKSLTNGNHLELEKVEDAQVCPDTSGIVAEEMPVPAENVEEPEVDIVINNVVCSFSVRCHLNLRQIALNGANVEYRRENGMITMKLRKPYTTASMWSSGKITCTGATSEDQAKIAARRFARCLQKLGFKTRFNNFRVVNVLGTCSMPFAIRITPFSERYKNAANYEPELHPGVTYKLKEPKATLKIFSTGSVTVTASLVIPRCGFGGNWLMSQQQQSCVQTSVGRVGKKVGESVPATLVAVELKDVAVEHENVPRWGGRALVQAALVAVGGRLRVWLTYKQPLNTSSL